MATAPEATPLTEGAISRIVSDYKDVGLSGVISDYNPVVQVWDMRIVTNKVCNMNYSLLVLSDGRHAQHSILSFNHDDLIMTLGRLKKGSLIHLTAFSFYASPRSRRIVVRSLNVVSETYDLIGNPKFYSEELPWDQNLQFEGVDLMQEGMRALQL